MHHTLAKANYPVAILCLGIFCCKQVLPYTSVKSLSLHPFTWYTKVTNIIYPGKLRYLSMLKKKNGDIKSHCLNCTHVLSFCIGSTAHALPAETFNCITSTQLGSPMHTGQIRNTMLSSHVNRVTDCLLMQVKQRHIYGHSTFLVQVHTDLQASNTLILYLAMVSISAYGISILGIKNMRSYFLPFLQKKVEGAEIFCRLNLPLQYMGKEAK